MVCTSVLMRGVLAQLLCAITGQLQHVRLAAEVEAARGTGLDAGRLEPRAHAVRAQRALVDLLRLRIKLGDIERAACDAILAANAELLLEIDDAVGVLHAPPVARTTPQPARPGALHPCSLPT